MDDRNAPVCWPSPDRFVIGILIQNPDGETHAATEELVTLDTGFRGEVLIPEAVYSRLRLEIWEFPQELWATGRTISDEALALKASEGWVMIPRLGRRFPTLFHTFAGNQRLLIGRGFLRRFRTLLDGPGSQVCLV